MYVYVLMRLDTGVPFGVYPELEDAQLAAEQEVMGGPNVVVGWTVCRTLLAKTPDERTVQAFAVHEMTVSMPKVYLVVKEDALAAFAMPHWAELEAGRVGACVQEIGVQ